MTQRLYYDDPYLARFTARVVERPASLPGAPGAAEGRGDRPPPGTIVVLDRTAFYPTGGGQPHDLGTLNGIPVVDVVLREDDDAVLHVLGRPLDEDEVAGEIDWPRRFDHMQQHSGQHILSAAFVHVLGATTVAFHLSDAYSTIDLDFGFLPRNPKSGEIDAVEALANQVIQQNRPVVARFVGEADVSGLPLRKPLKHAGPVRVVEITGFECSGCGGTHVRATGEIGLLKITRTERRGVETRVEFLAGGRALADYRLKHRLLIDLAQEFTVGYREVGDLVRRLAADLKETRHDLRRARDALLEMEAAALRRDAPRVGPVRVVRAHLPGRTPDDLKHLAQRLAAEPDTVALLAAGDAPGDKAAFTFARSAGVDVHVGAVLREACDAIGGRGGGRPDFAQGGAPQADRAVEALDEAFRRVVDRLRPASAGPGGPAPP